MTPEQKEAFCREVQEAFDRAQYTPGDHPVVPVKMAQLMEDLRRALAASQPAPAREMTGFLSTLSDEQRVTALGYGGPDTPAADTGQAVAAYQIISYTSYPGATWIAPHKADEYRREYGCALQPLYTHPAPLDAERVREAWAYRVHDCHIARSPVKARAKFPEATEHLYPASRHADAIEMARLLGGTCTPLYPPEDAR